MFFSDRNVASLGVKQALVQSIEKLRRWLASELGRVILIALVSRLIVFVSAIVGQFILGPAKTNDLGVINIPIVSLFSQWDSYWYATIALFGYPPGNNPISMNWAFFPLYPISMRVFGELSFGTLTPLQSVVASGFLMNNVLFFVSLFLFYKVTKSVLGSTKIALVSTVFFAFWPGSLFFSSVYSESLFMVLTLGAFYLLEREKGNEATLVGFFACLARSNGFLIFIPFFYKGLQERKYLRAILQSVVLVLPYLLFNFYGYFLTGVFPVREIVYDHNWSSSRISLSDLAGVWGGYTLLYSVEAVLVLIPFFWFLLTEKTPIKDFITASNGERKDLKYWAFSVYLILTVLFYSDPKNIHRYVIPMLPLYWVFALIWSKNNKVGKILLCVLTALLVIGTILFTTGRLYL